MALLTCSRYSKSMKNLSYLIIFICLFSTQALAQFSAPVKVENHVTIELKTDQDAFVPGRGLTLGIVQNIPEGWHTYWFNPGDSGAESHFDFVMPDGFKMTGIQWPTPERIPYDILMNFGYEDQAVFLTEVIAPEQIGAYFATISVEANWLVCKDICIPEHQKLELTLPVEQNANKINTEFFNSARSKIPSSLDTTATYSEDGDDFILRLDRASLPDENYTAFFPFEYGLIKNAPVQTIVSSPSTVVFSAPRDLRKLTEVDQSSFVIVSENNAYRINATRDKTVTAVPTPPPAARDGFFYHVILALLGGLILNLMPCVFPVLSLKALSIVKLRGEESRDIIWHGISYTGGVIISFAIFAAIILGLRHTGAVLGWGFHLQNPFNILILSYLMFAIGLNLLNVYTIGGRFMNFGQGLGNNKTKLGSFFTGVLAALVATPCTAPFMAAAIGYATVQPALKSFTIFVMVGFGLALPYLLLTIIPPLQKILPRPGQWMETFKKLLSIPMFLTVVWLLWVLYQQAGLLAVIYAAMGLALLTVILKQKHLSQVFAGLFVLILLMPFMPKDIVKDSESLNRWSPEKLEQALDTDQPVFVNMTASWCITCKVNENTTLTSETVEHAFQDYDVIYLVGDWTNEDLEITKFMREFNRNGVPLYVYYPAPENGVRAPAVVLPQILTPSIVTDAITE